MSKCSVYVIESDSGHYKIGLSNDPERRLKELTRTQGPFVYRLIKTIEFSSRAFAEDAEERLHLEFDRHRVNGEWFEFDAAELIELGGFLYELDQVDYVHNRQSNLLRKFAAEVEAELPY